MGEGRRLGGQELGIQDLIAQNLPIFACSRGAAFWNFSKYSLVVDDPASKDPRTLQDGEVRVRAFLDCAIRGLVAQILGTFAYSGGEFFCDFSRQFSSAYYPASRNRSRVTPEPLDGRDCEISASFAPLEAPDC